ncbi:MAG TPA: hypothetical protein VHK63_02950, partial [Candidatus Limnocylindria bacterium]|nr:hypothetical protein [Candidatus Limnocylindria bacterium]
MTARGILAGTLAGLAAAGASFLIAELTGEPAPILSLLAVAAVGLTAGAAAALWTYGVAGLFLIWQAASMSGEPTSGAEAYRLVAFVVGAPVIVVLAMRLERERRSTRQAHELSAAAEEQARRQRG